MAAGAEGMPWPPPNNQLEKWMMNTVKEGDRAAVLMREILNMNPAFGVKIREDEDLVGVVQLFAKRFRKISLAEGSAQMSPTVLYQPLCEMVWRVVGLTMHSMMNLNDQSAMPVVKEATGMIKMLLQTNTELSSQLSQLRRMYFKELTGYRDKSRRMSKQVEHALKGLEEQPIMFFEPLEFVLDETTKQFVREAIEERMKLELRTQFKQDDGNAEVALHLEQVEKDLQETQAKVRVLNNTVAREAEVRKRHEETEQKLREELKALREGGTDSQKDMGKLQEEIERLRTELRREQKKAMQRDDEPTVVEKIVEVEKIVVDNSAANAELEKLRKQIKDIEAESKKKDEQIKAEQKKAQESEKAAKATGAKEIIKEKIVYQEDTESIKKLEKSLEVEKELREALRVSELRAKELESKEPKIVHVEKEADKKKKKKKEEEEPEEVKKPKKDNTDKKIQEAIDKVTEEFQGRIKSLADKLSKAKEQLEEKERIIEELMGSDADAKKKAKAAAAEAARLAADGEDMAQWRVKYHELEDKYEDLQHEYEKLQAQVRGLVDRMRDNMTEEEIKETMIKIEMSAPPPRKKRKKKAFERLYDDAQRRIVEMRMKQAKLKEIEEKAVRKVIARVSDKTSLRKAEVLTSLHKAKVETTELFENALSEFQDSMPEGKGGPDYDDMVEDSSDPEASEGLSSTIVAQRKKLMEQARTGGTGPGGSSRDLSPTDSQPLPADMVCPRCGYHTASLYGKQSPTSTGPVANSTVSSMDGRFSNVLMMSAPTTPPWMAPAAPAMPSIMGRQMMLSGTSSLSSTLGTTLGRQMGAESRRDRSPGPTNSRAYSPASANIRTLSPASLSGLSPTVMASQGGVGAGARFSTTSLSASMPIMRGRDNSGMDRMGASGSSWTRPTEIEPLGGADRLAVTAVGQRMETPTTVKHSRSTPGALLADGLVLDGTAGLVSASQRQALFSSAPPWRADAGADRRSPSPPPALRAAATVVRAAATFAQGSAASSPSRSGSPTRQAKAELSVISPDLDVPSNTWFGLQATPPWRRGTATGTSASRAASGSDRQVSVNNTMAGNPAAAAAPAPTNAPRSIPPAAGVGGVGRSVRSTPEWTPSASRRTPLEPIQRQVSFSGLDVSPRQRLAPGAPRSLSPEDGSAKSEAKPMDDVDPSSPARLSSAPSRNSSGYFSEPGTSGTTGTVTTSIRRPLSPPEGVHAVTIGGGGRMSRYSTDHSQQLPSVTSVRSVPLLPVTGRQMDPENMRDAQWESVRRPGSKMKKATHALFALGAMKSGASKSETPAETSAA